MKLALGSVLLAIAALSCATQRNDSLAAPSTSHELAASVDASAPAPTPKMRVHFINVGQGAATLFEFPHGAVLVDTGGEKDDLFDSTSELDT